MKIAAFTIVKNEFVFLPIWYKYYKEQLGEKNVFVYDNNSLEPCYLNGVKPYNYEVLDSEYAFDHGWLRSTAFAIMFHLLLHYDYVICTDADEILIPDANKYGSIYYGSMHEYVSKHQKEILYSTGYEVLSKKDSPPIDFSDFLLKQREKWVKLRNFYKPVISSVPIKKMYSDYNCAANGDPDLYLVHLNRIDFATALERNRCEREYKWNPSTLAKTDGWQHRIQNDKEFEEYFKAVKKVGGKVVDIPGWMKEQL